jgi:hypothetical protein
VIKTDRREGEGEEEEEEGVRYQSIVACIILSD